MFTYVPKKLGASPALVVVLHGCTQSAASYDLGAGWSTLAERYGFVLLLPEQTQANNPKTCFNWFLPGDTARDRGEALSIRQMIEKTIGAHGVDRGTRFHHRAVRRRRDDGGDAGHLSGGVRGRRDHRGIAVRDCGQRAAGLREHVPGKDAHREGVGRPGAARIDASRSVAARLGLAWRRRRDREAGECGRPHRGNGATCTASTLRRSRTGSTAIRARSGGATAIDVIESYTITGMAHGTPLATGTRTDSAAWPGRSCSRSEFPRPTTSRSSSA